MFSQHSARVITPVNREQVQSPAYNLNVSHQSGKNSFQKNLLFIAEDHTRLKARRRESQFFLPFLLASCLTSLLSLRSYVHKHKPETIFQYSFYHLFSLSSGINDPQTVFTLVVVCITVLLLLARVCFGMFKKFGPHKVVVRPYLVDRTLLLLIFTFCFSSFSQEYLSTDAELNGADVYIPVSSAVFVCWCVFVCVSVFFFCLMNGRPPLNRKTDEGLTPEASALGTLYEGQFTSSAQLIKPNYPANS